MPFIDYYAYLSTKKWRKKRNQALLRSGYSCSICRGKGHLQVHHLHYDTLGRENVRTDLQVLCEGCHSNLHEGEVPGCLDPLTREFLQITKR